MSETWASMLSLRPCAGSDNGSRAIEVSDPFGRKRARVDATSMLELLGSQYRGSQVRSHRAEELHKALGERGWLGDPVARNEGAQRWWDRGWHPSLSYYAWSRERRYADLADTTGEVRTSTITKWLAEDGPPPARRCPEGPRISLPDPPPLPTSSTGAVLLARKTTRGYRGSHYPLTVLSATLWHALEDVRQRRRLDFQDPLDYLQTHGVAFDFYVVSYSVDALEPGVYFYELVENDLTLIRRGEFREEMARIIQGYRAPETAAWTIVMTADFIQYQWRYRHERALRHLYMATGRVAQRLILVGHTFGMGTLPTPATRDREVSNLLELDPIRQGPMYTLTMGRTHVAKS